MPDLAFYHVKKKLLYAAGGLIAVLLAGTIGYRYFSGGKSSFVDSFYMTFITIATIGFGEIVDLSGKPAGRLFTVLISLAGIGIMTYVVMTMTSFIVEGEMSEAFRRRRMQKSIERFRGHYIVCGAEGAALHVVRELASTGRDHLMVDDDREKLNRAVGHFPELVFIEGDPTDNDTLAKAGIVEAKGLFAATEEDHQNLVISLTAKQLNPRVKVVVSCHEIKNAEKMKKAGADAVVSPTYIGGLRMASEMIRPAVVTFLDVMMSRKEVNLRVEEIAVPQGLAGRSISSLNLKQYDHLLLLAVKSKEEWLYNPSREYLMKPGDVLIIMSTAEERGQLEKLFSTVG